MYTLKLLQKQYDAMVDVFSENQSVETCCFFLCSDVEAPSGATLLVKGIISLNAEDYHHRSVNRLSVSPKTMLKVVREAQQKDLAICMVHNHPNSPNEVEFSLADDIGNIDTFKFFNRMLYGKKNSCLVWNSNFRKAAGRIYNKPDSWSPIDSIHVLGESFPLVKISPQESSSQQFASSLFDRQVRLIGQAGQEQLNSMKIGIVGAGGIGSAVSQLLGHSGSNNIALIDPDAIEDSNLPRLVGSNSNDLEKQTYKVDIAKRYLKAIAPEANITVFKQSVEEPSLLPIISTLDVIVCGTDNTSSRAFLNQLCHQFYVPVLDLGVEFVANKSGSIVNEIGKANLMLPGSPCLQCTGHINAEQLRSEQCREEEREALIEQGYIKGYEVPQPSMMMFNMEVAARGVQLLLSYLTGLTKMEFHSTYEQFSFLGIANRPHVKQVRKRKDCHCIYCGDLSSFLGSGSSQPLLLSKSA